MWAWRALASGSPPRKSCRTAIVALTLMATGGGAARAADIFQFDLPNPVTAITETANGLFVTVGDDTFQFEPCERPEGLCLSTGPFDAVAAPAPDGALPDGMIATAETGDIRRAWYGRPTDRYDHGVLGDAIEGGSLVVETANGRRREFALPENQVFEDITPRIHDLDGDGANEIVTIRSSLTGGAAVAVYGLADGELVERGTGSENGQANRWLNIAGVKAETIYGVRTPHIGGRLFALRYEDGRFTEENDIARDLSNHIIGSRDLGLSALGDLDGDGEDELVIPSQDRTRLRFPLSDRPDIGLPEPVTTGLAIANGHIVTRTQDGKLLVIVP